MVKITLGVEGMMCIRCEEHANHAISEKFNVKSVVSSHKEKSTIILSAKDIPDDQLKEAISKAGYKVTSIKREEEKKKGFWIFGK